MEGCGGKRSCSTSSGAVSCADDDLAITGRLAEYTGRRVCAPLYRLAPEHPFPAARDDAEAVYRALCERAGGEDGGGRGGADGEGARVVVVGESAGGNLALGLVLATLQGERRAGPLPLPLAVAFSRRGSI